MTEQFREDFKDPAFREALAELMARAQTMGDPEQWVVVGMDRTLTPPTVSAHGPYDGPTALIQAQRLREQYDGSELADVEVHIAAWWGQEGF